MKDKPLLITLIIVIILFVLMVATSSGNIFGAKSIIGGVLQPVQGFFYDVTASVATFFSNIFSGAKEQQDVAALERKIEEQDGIIRYHEETLKENERLKELLNFAELNTQYKYVGAKVTGKSPGAWFTSFTISAGINQGVRKDMAVISGKGVIGKVTEVYANYSTVMPIIDDASNISGLVERTRNNGILRGTINTSGNTLLTMSYMPLEADIIPGDKVITSGTDKIYPPGLVIGEVVEVETGVESTEKSATVKPVVDFQRIEEVLVVISYDSGEAK